MIELLPSKVPLYDDGPRQQYIGAFVRGLSQLWPNCAFVDAQLLRPHFLIEGKSPLREALRQAEQVGTELIPVVPLPRAFDDPHLTVFDSISSQKAGLCIRLKPVDFELPLRSRNRLIEQTLKHFGLDPAQVDLIVDEEFTYEDARTYEEICDLVPHLALWRSFTVVSGDFPADLQEYSRGLIHPRRRSDWRRWQQQAGSPSQLPRQPSYGDYTVQYAAYRPFPPDQIPNPSISVRYTDENEWLICRGEAPRVDGPGTEQWVGWAQLLCAHPAFKGCDFSAGDRYIYERASGTTSHGSATTWISASINHHITLTARQVASVRAA